MTGAVQKVGLDDEDRTHFAWLSALAGIEIGQIEDTAAGSHDSARPSPAR
jgi:hypothetical protein